MMKTHHLRTLSGGAVDILWSNNVWQIYLKRPISMCTSATGRPMDRPILQVASLKE